MAKTWFDIDGTVPVVGIYTGDDDAPLYNPTTYIGTRTKFSTLYNYIPFVPAKRIVANLTIPQNIGYVPRGAMTRLINLGAHGMPGIPFIYGFVTMAGIIRPLCGSVPVGETASAFTGSGIIIHWTLGVDAVNVFISEGRSYPNVGISVPNVSVEVYISDKVI